MVSLVVSCITDSNCWHYMMDIMMITCFFSGSLFQDTLHVPGVAEIKFAVLFCNIYLFVSLVEY